ncbi:hypothetical protein EZS27_003575 [termite gut metagenome]|uniref:Uncharacterized protein n=1 Tax=termite gut metagenome TaxID=433724 RepID=A0A5J4SUV0_9ZZZZ
MIKIKKYAEFLQDIRGRVNGAFANDKQHITGTVLSVQETSMQKKLKDMPGIYLCAGYPSCETEIEHSDNYTEKYFCVLFLLEKINAGSWTDEQELDFYDRMQEMAEEIQEILISDNRTCDYGFAAPKTIRVEWEYNIFGGWYGLSLGFEIKEQ